MRFESDSEEAIRCFNQHSVEFLLVGAYALAQPATQELDLYIRPTPENARRVVQAHSSRSDSQAWKKRKRPLVERSS